MAGTNDEELDLEALIKWKTDCEAELMRVDATLQKVAKVCTECDGDDTIYGCFKKLGEGIANAYIETSNVFKEAMGKTDELITNIKKRLSGIGQKIEDFKNNFHR